MAADRVARSRGAGRRAQRRRQGRLRRGRACRAKKCASRSGAGRTTGSRRRWSSCAARARSGSCRAARTSASAAAARCSTCTSPRRSRPSSARSKTRSGISARSGPSACCGRSRARPGATASAPGCRCATSSRRARCWSASTSASRASSPRSRAATSCRAHVSDLLLPLRELIGAMATRDRLPQIELAVGDDVHRAGAAPSRAAARRATSRCCASSRARHGVEWWLQPKGPGDGAAARRRRLGARLRAARVRHPRCRSADRFHPGQPRRSTAALVSRALRLLDVRRRRARDRLVLRPRQLHAAAGDAGRARCSASKAAPPWSSAPRAAAALERPGGARRRFAARNLFEVDAADLAALGSADSWLIDPPREGAFAIAKALADLRRRRRRARDGWRPPRAHRLRQLQPGDAGARRRPAGASRRLPLHGGRRGQHVPAHGARRKHRRLRSPRRSGGVTEPIASRSGCSSSWSRWRCSRRSNGSSCRASAGTCGARCVASWTRSAPASRSSCPSSS